MTTKEIVLGANRGIAVRANGTPVGPITKQERFEGAETIVDDVVGPCPVLDFSSDFTVELQDDGSVKISLA